MLTEQFEQRMAKLEATVERQSRILKVLGVVLVAMGLGAAAAPLDVLRASKLEIVDANGSVAASLQPHGRGGGMVELFDAFGQSVMSLSANDGGRLIIRGVDGGDLIQLGEALARHAGAIIVRNTEGQVVVHITADTSGDGYVGVFDGAGIGKTLQPQPSDALGSRRTARP